MRWGDLIRTGFSNLVGRPFRTGMTVLGVVIGTMAVVLMISLGIGMTKSTVDSLKNNSSMTQIRVSGSSATSTSDPKFKYLNQAAISDLSKYPGVVDVIPTYAANGTIKFGSEQGWVNLTGVRAQDFSKLNLDIAEGSLPSQAGPFSVVMGGKVYQNFGWDSQEGSQPIDWMKETVFFTFEGLNSSDAQSQSFGTGFDTGMMPQSSDSKMIYLPVSGVLKNDEDSFSETDYYSYVDLDQLVKAMRAQTPSDQPLPGQPFATSDKSPQTMVYSTLILQTDSAQTTETLIDQLREDGWTADSNLELVKQMQNIALVIQAVFGGIGFISLLVAAIGIANTMMMSVYERTKDIGIMKVLGASLRDIRNAFLIEAAGIGFLGGLIGLILSWLISLIANTAGQALANADISVITPWLALSAVAFATFIGGISGFLPARRAMKMSPLAAIRAQ